MTGAWPVSPGLMAKPPQRPFPAGGKANIMRGRAPTSARIEMSDNGRRGEEGPGTGVIVKAKPKTKKPSMYKVLMLNDDYTPMEFVVHILERFFSKNRQEATRIMLHVHRRGVGICGVYTYEVAETKVTQVMDFARQHQHPLQCTLEKD
jgi:ATP-dependent Clp protease adaptor protein ClpS